MNGKTVPTLSKTIFGGPAMYYSDGESYESCQETIDNDDDNDDDDVAGDIYTDTVDTVDDKSDKKYLSTWL